MMWKEFCFSSKMPLVSTPGKCLPNPLPNLQAERIPRWLRCPGKTLGPTGSPQRAGARARAGAEIVFLSDLQYNEVSPGPCIFFHTTERWHLCWGIFRWKFGRKAHSTNVHREPLLSPRDHLYLTTTANRFIYTWTAFEGKQENH